MAEDDKQGRLRNAMIAIGSILVAGVFIWFDEGGKVRVFDWFRGSKIEVSAVGASADGPYLAAQPLRFKLKNAEPQQVFWLFDEREVQPGNIEIEHAFGFDERQPTGISASHRVDAFFREGASYRSASKTLETQNFKLATRLEIHPTGLSVSANRTWGIGSDFWVLDKAAVKKFENGTYKPVATFDLSTAMPEDSKKVSGTVSKETLTKLFSLPETADLRTQHAALGDAYISYDLRNPEGSKAVTIIQPILGEKGRALSVGLKD